MTHHPYLKLKDSDKGLGRAYTRLEADAPSLAVANDGGKATAVRAKMTRMVAPEAIKYTSLDQPFNVVAWPGLATETVLAAKRCPDACEYPSGVKTAWAGRSPGC